MPGCWYSQKCWLSIVKVQAHRPRLTSNSSSSEEADDWPSGRSLRASPAKRRGACRGPSAASVVRILLGDSEGWGQWTVLPASAPRPIAIIAVCVTSFPRGENIALLLLFKEKESSMK